MSKQKVYIKVTVCSNDLQTEKWFFVEPEYDISVEGEEAFLAKLAGQLRQADNFSFYDPINKISVCFKCSDIFVMTFSVYRH